jgi:hypothetical protein
MGRYLIACRSSYKLKILLKRAYIMCRDGEIRFNTKILIPLVAIILFSFVIAATVLLLPEEATAAELYSGIGWSGINAQGSTGRFGVRAKNWELETGLYGHGRTDLGTIREPVRYISFSRVIRSQKRFLGGKVFYKSGIAYVDDHPLVGKMNFNLSAGIDFGVVKISGNHKSSADIFETNKGTNSINVDFYWEF